jgi:hypothetical protein
MRQCPVSSHVACWGQLSEPPPGHTRPDCSQGVASAGSVEGQLPAESSLTSCPASVCGEPQPDDVWSSQAASPPHAVIHNMVAVTKTIAAMDSCRGLAMGPPNGLAFRCERQAQLHQMLPARRRAGRAETQRMLLRASTSARDGTRSPITKTRARQLQRLVRRLHSACAQSFDESPCVEESCSPASGTGAGAPYS